MSNYANDTSKRNREKIHALCTELPDFVKDYVSCISMSAASSSLLQYLYTIKKFFQWWFDFRFVSDSENLTVKDIPITDIPKVTPSDIQEFVMGAGRDNLSSTENRKTLARRCAALNSLFGYFADRQIIEFNPMTKVRRPKIPKDKKIIRLENNEPKDMLTAIRETPIVRKSAIGQRERDTAIFLLLINTGIRVSECVGINMEDVSFKTNSVNITRKGGKTQSVPLNKETVAALSEYYDIRRNIENVEGSPLFISNRNSRISTHTVENLISKYALAAGVDRKITPHKLRKTYGTALYASTHDIYLVADALGHDDPRTTIQHYVAASYDRLREHVEDTTYTDTDDKME